MDSETIDLGFFHHYTGQDHRVPQSSKQKLIVKAISSSFSPPSRYGSTPPDALKEIVNFERTIALLYEKNIPLFVTYCSPRIQISKLNFLNFTEFHFVGTDDRFAQ